MRFLFYDRILALEIGQRALALKAVALSEEFFPEHYPRRPIMPATLLVETMAQVAGWLNVVSNNFAVDTVLVLVEGVRIVEQARPGDLLTVEVHMMFQHHEGSTLKGEICRDQDTIATVDRMVFANGRVSDTGAIERERERFAYLSGNYDLDGGHT